ncbi:MAG: dienelactone hydrolase family protein [Ilumatobacteraceae bacterium]
MTSAATDVLAGWERASFSAAGFTHDTYRRGSGPGVVVIHEIPGITPAVTRFANEVVDRGFTVVMPDLVGTPGREVSIPYTLGSFARVCVSNEVTAWALNRTTPVTSWLRAVARALHAEVGGPGVGAVGMCFSGGFALGMMVDEIMIAPVVSQHSFPIARGSGAASGNLGLSPDDEAAMVCRAEAGCEVLGLRFTGDRMVGTRFDTLREKLGDAFIAVELPSASRFDHSVLTEHRDDASVGRVIDFLAAKLLPN